MTTITPQQFVEKWRYVTFNERSACQSHFLDLCRLAKHPEPVEMDPKGAFFRFEKGTVKQAGGEGFAEAARELVRLRDHWLNPAGCGEAELKKRTLTNLYNQHPLWLQNAHARLDPAALAAYGWENGPGEEVILERLLGLNLERAKGGV